MGRRTTIVLDDESQAAARDLARQLQCTMSEAIRTAVVRYRDLSAGVPPELRSQRIEALGRLIALFEGHDGRAEIRRLKAEDSGF